MSTTVKGKARIYACGGAGINIGKKLEQFRGTSEAGVADLEITYIDTSRSNLDSTVSGEHCYLLEGLDGSGKIRRDNYKAISDNTRKILQSFGPLDVNIIISSGSGGSGSVIAPSLATELLDNDQNVIVIVIGSSDSRIDIDNTLKTLKSYDAISQKRERPVVAAYFQNSAETSRSKVDESVVSVLFSLTTLFSRENRELDTRDLYNFLNYHRVTSFKPKLVGLTVHIGDVPADAMEDVITVASVVKDEVSLSFIPEYRCVGYISPDVTPEIAQNLPMHFLTHNDSFAAVADALAEKLESLDKVQKARIESKTVITSKDVIADDGMVL